MSNINIFKIDDIKEISLDNALKNYTCYAIGEKKLDDLSYHYELYVYISPEKKDVSWNWVVNEFGKSLDSIDSPPSGLLI